MTHNVLNAGRNGGSRRRRRVAVEVAAPTSVEKNQVIRDGPGAHTRDHRPAMPDLDPAPVSGTEA
ncbi:hypothetical protein [Actinacidiphila alni]|uniref:hypothetical protein n=1 Tax=Actinacidiphila alni TaxID=380248 RepID=UPI00345319B3